MKNLSLFHRNIEYFLSTCSAKTISEAAQTVGLSQSALSMALANLEEELNLKLFHRQRSGLSLTNSGKQFRELCLSTQRHFIEKQELFKTQQRCLHVGGRRYLNGHDLLESLQKLKNINFKYFSRRAVEIYRAVEDEHLDFGFVGWPSPPQGKLKAVEVFRVKIAIVGLKSKFAQIARAKSFSDLLELPWIYALREDAMWAKALENHPSGYCVDPYMLKDLVIEGKGIAEVEMDWFSKDEKSLLAYAPVESRYPTGAVYLVHKINLDPEVERLMNEVLKDLKTSAKLGSGKVG